MQNLKHKNRIKSKIKNKKIHKIIFKNKMEWKVRKLKLKKLSLQVQCRDLRPFNGYWRKLTGIDDNNVIFTGIDVVLLIVLLTFNHSFNGNRR